LLDSLDTEIALVQLIFEHLSSLSLVLEGVDSGRVQPEVLDVLHVVGIISILLLLSLEGHLLILVVLVDKIRLPALLDSLHASGELVGATSAHGL